MSKLLIILSLLLRLVASYIELFESGWRIELYAANGSGKPELKLVRHWWSRLFRGIRYLRGTEGEVVPRCDECGKTEKEHELCCPEDALELEPKEMIALLREQGVLDGKAPPVVEDPVAEMEEIADTES